MKKSYKVRLLDHDFQIRSESDDQYVNAIVDYVREKLEEAMGSSRSLASMNLAILAALNIADEFFRERRELKARIQHLEMRAESLSQLIDTHLGSPR